VKKLGDWFAFPFVFKPNVAAIDKAMRGFAAGASWFFEDIVGQGLIRLVNGVQWGLAHIPWFLLVALVFFLGWKARGKLRSGILYAGMLCLVGVVGLWTMMLQTLSIVLASVLIALILGFPVGILLSASDRATKIVRPILDTMQTMPVFVYLIPALLFFGMGSASAVIATVIYAIVPVIRLTSLGIRQVDEGVVEASRAFGATRLQTLAKVQIPQAMPTIMAGVNQTLMMAMAMVVTCSMIGARGLGGEVLIAVNRTEIGRGLVSGLSVVALAILMDRLTQGWFGEKKKAKGPEGDRNG
jgi:glycine betaine/proline transport system permease protein/glycine betaine/proline transport system substrate-binding protein